jgi:hypothetical protein
MHLSGLHLIFLAFFLNAIRWNVPAHYRVADFLLLTYQKIIALKRTFVLYRSSFIYLAKGRFLLGD